MTTKSRRWWQSRWCTNPPKFRQKSLKGSLQVWHGRKLQRKGWMRTRHFKWINSHCSYVYIRYYDQTKWNRYDKYLRKLQTAKKLIWLLCLSNEKLPWTSCWGSNYGCWVSGEMIRVQKLRLYTIYLRSPQIRTLTDICPWLTYQIFKAK